LAVRLAPDRNGTARSRIKPSQRQMERENPWRTPAVPLRSKQKRGRSRDGPRKTEEDGLASGADDLFGGWRTLLQRWGTQADTATNSVTGQEGFSREMNRSVSAALQMQAAFNEAVNKALVTFNLPSRDDIARLSEQIRALERKVDALADAA